MRRALAAAALVALAATLVAGPAHAAAGLSASPIEPHARPLDVPQFEVFSASGEAIGGKSLAGRITVMNLWATWCSPCLRELPSLDRLQQALGAKVRVIAVSQDREGAKAASPYLARLGIRHLEVLYDRDATLTRALRARVLPQTVILDANGRELARYAGELDWSSDAVVRFLEQITGG